MALDLHTQTTIRHIKENQTILHVLLAQLISKCQDQDIHLVSRNTNRVDEMGIGRLLKTQMEK